MNTINGEIGSTGCVGRKGTIGLSSEYTPQWIIDIIKFRNDKYEEDSKRALSEKRPVEAVEREYDTIDHALRSLVNLNDHSVKPTGGARGIAGCCGGDNKDINHC